MKINLNRDDTCFSVSENCFEGFRWHINEMQKLDLKSTFNTFFRFLLKYKCYAKAMEKDASVQYILILSLLHAIHLNHWINRLNSWYKWMNNNWLTNLICCLKLLSCFPIYGLNIFSCNQAWKGNCGLLGKPNWLILLINTKAQQSHLKDNDVWCFDILHFVL